MNYINQRLAVYSPLNIEASGSITGSGAQIAVDVTVETAQPAGNYRLYVAMVEKHIYLPSPNGETDHHWVFRRINNNDGNPMGEPIEETFSPYSSWRCRIFWISDRVSFMTFFTPPPASMNRTL